MSEHYCEKCKSVKCDNPHTCNNEVAKGKRATW